MLENITEKFSGIMRSLSGKSKITEKNIEEAVEQINIKPQMDVLLRKIGLHFMLERE